jgi:DNA-binding NtrC family response regulator
MERARVLVVDDKPAVLKLMAAILEPAYEVTTAPDGAAALALVATATFDVVIADVRMPRASGFDVLRAVKRDAPRTSIVVMTAYGNVPDAVAAMRLGAYDYVTKPIDVDEISLVIARAVEQRTSGAPTQAPLAATRATSAEDDMELQVAQVGFHRAVEQARARASVEYLAALMRLFHGNVMQAAARAGMTRESLYRVLKQHGVDPDRYRDPARMDGHARTARASGED